MIKPKTRHYSAKELDAIHVDPDGRFRHPAARERRITLGRPENTLERILALQADYPLWFPAGQHCPPTKEAHDAASALVQATEALMDTPRLAYAGPDNTYGDGGIFLQWNRKSGRVNVSVPGNGLHPQLRITSNDGTWEHCVATPEKLAVALSRLEKP